MKPIGIGFVIVLAGVTLPALQVQAARPANFGTQWVQSHPLTLMALTGQPSKYDATEYQGAGLNTTLSWEQNSQIPLASYNASLPWHYQSDHQPLSQVQTNFTSYYALAPNAQGALVWDEPSGDMSEAAAHANWFRLAYPNLLTYTNALGYGAFGSPVTYETYLQDVINAVQPDVLMYDTYPFIGAQGGTYASYFQNLESVRKVARQQSPKIPYWTFLQSYQDVPSARRLPSGSELRMQVFSSLTYGFTGLAYFTYEATFERGLLDAGGEPNAHYYRAAQVNAEVAKLGNTLRKLESTDVRFVPGRNGPGGVNTNATPGGMTNWASGAGSDTHILSVLVDTTQSANIGLGKDGLIGFFKDNANTPYFMLSNLYHGAGLDAEDTNLEFTIQFDGTINSLLLLNRLTGAEDTISLTGNKLTWTLPGGTADLFKYNDGFGFALALSEASNPEPASLAIMALAATALLRRRRRMVAP